MTSKTYIHTFQLASDTHRDRGRGFDAVEGGVDGSGADGAGGVADATRTGAGAGGGEGGVALTDTGYGTGTYISLGRSVGGTLIGVTHGTSGLCQVTSREYTTLPLSSSSSL